LGQRLPPGQHDGVLRFRHQPQPAPAGRAGARRARVPARGRGPGEAGRVVRLAADDGRRCAGDRAGARAQAPVAGDGPRHARRQHEHRHGGPGRGPRHRRRTAFRPRALSPGAVRVSDFDLVVLGGGSGGLAGAFRAAGHGARVAILEPAELGGTCVNVGCVPKKAMWLAGDIAHKLALARELGFDLPETPPALDWPAFIAFRQRYINNIHASYRKRLDAAGIAVLPVRGRLAGNGVVECSDGVRIRSPQVLVATGGRPVRPSIPGAELGIDSDGFFHLAAAPARVALIGGGYIAVELAGVLQALGSRVELFVRGRRLLKGFDTDIATQLVEDYRQHGIQAHFDSTVQSLHRTDDGIAVRGSDARDSGPFDTVIFATGRRPNSDGIGLEEAGVELDPRGHVLVDAFQRTSADGVHALGDVTDRIALTPVAIAAARRLMDRLFGGRTDARLDYDDIATV